MKEIKIQPIEIVHSEKTIEKKQFFGYAEQVALKMKEAGISEGEKAVLIARQRPETIFAVIAMWKIGAVPVLAEPGIKNDELEAIKSAASADIVIEPENLVINDQVEISEEEFLTVNAKNEAAIMFTSGSSGQPKGVIHSFGNLYSSYEGYRELTGKDGGSWLASLPFSHIGGFSIITRSLFSGSKVILPDSLKSADLYEAIRNYDPENISLVPTMMNRINDKGYYANKSHKHLFIGGAGAGKELVIGAKSLGWQPYVVYGSTETASMVTALTPEEFEGKPNSSGKPLKGSEVNVFGKSGKPNKPFVTGRIGVKGNSLMKGYMNGQPVENVNGFFLTQDTGFIDEEGFLYVRSRIDNIIISGGKNIDPVEVEKYILGIEGIKEAVVAGKQDAEWGQKVIAFIVKGNPYLNEDKILAELKSRLAAYKIPKEIIFIDEIPKNELGKINRPALLGKL